MHADTIRDDKKKRQHLCLPIAQKVKLLEKLNSSAVVKHRTEQRSSEMATIYNLKKQRNKLLFCAESNEHKLMTDRKTLHKTKNDDLDRADLEANKHLS